MMTTDDVPDFLQGLVDPADVIESVDHWDIRDVTAVSHWQTATIRDETPTGFSRYVSPTRSVPEDEARDRFGGDF
jgi:hypothetical protein